MATKILQKRRFDCSRIVSKKYKRHIAPGQKRDIMHSQRVDAGRDRRQSVFKMTVSSPFFKTPRMLQDCYDKLKARKDASLEVPPQQCAEKKDFDKCFEKFDRAHAPAVSKATPEQFPIDDPLMSPQKSFTLNPEGDGKSWSKGKTFKPMMMCKWSIPKTSACR
jgi:hypothetical protein